MPYYILTLVLTPEGRENLLTDSEILHWITSEEFFIPRVATIHVAGRKSLGSHHNGR